MISRAEVAWCRLALTLAIFVASKAAHADKLDSNHEYVEEDYVANYEVDITSKKTYEEVLRQGRLLRLQEEHEEDLLFLQTSPPPDLLAASVLSRRKRRQSDGVETTVRDMPEIPFREMAAFVREAERSVAERLDELEPRIYRSEARQVPRSPEWFMSASSKIKVAAKNMSRVALIAEEATKYISKRYDLSKDDVTYGLPLADVRGTRLSTLCQVKVDFPCQPGKYRAYNGYCNNVQNPNWGVANRRYLRYLPPDYADGISIPRQRQGGRTSAAAADAAAATLGGGDPENQARFLRSPREISVAVHREAASAEGGSAGGERDRPHPHLMVIAGIWGEFLLHDVAHTPQTAGFLGQRLKCCDVKFEDFHPECYPIKIPDGDPFYGRFDLRCQEYARSATASRTGCTLGPREQINQVTSFIDGSAIYGSSKSEAEGLRSFSGGQLKVQSLSGSGGRKSNGVEDMLLPADDSENDLDCRMDDDGSGGGSGAGGRKCFKAGDVRVNEHPSLVAMHTLWLRQHNQLATRLSGLNPHWNDEQIYQEARRIVGAQIQHITYTEFLPVILGKEAVDHYNLQPQPMGFFNGYDINTNPGTANSVATAAMRFTTSIMPGVIRYYGGGGGAGAGQQEQQQPGADLESLVEDFYKPDDLYEANMVEHIFTGLIRSHAMAEDLLVGQEMTDKMFMDPESYGFGLDLVAQIIQQGRDHGLPAYKEWRSFCGLPAVKSFEDLQDVMSETTVGILRDAYDSVDDVDLFTGGLAEVPTKGAVVGPTFACLIGRQMFYFKTGDRYWYENDIPPSSFTKDQLNEIRRTSLAQVICENVPSISTVQPQVFIKPDPFLNAPMPCKGQTSSVRSFDLTSWTTASPRFIVPDNMLVDSIERAKRDAEVMKEMEFNLWKEGHGADPKSAVGSSYGFMKPKSQAVEISNSSRILQFASRIFLDRLLQGGGAGLDSLDEDGLGFGGRAKRQLQDAEFDNKGIGNLQELMDVLPNIDVSDVMEIPRVFRCDEQTLPCDHTTKYRTLTGWCNNLLFPEYGKSVRTFTRLLAPAYDDGLMSPRSRSVTGAPLPSPRLISVNIHNDVSTPHVRYSLFVMQWAQMVDHDLTHTPVNRGFKASILECKACDSKERIHPECLPIPIPEGDPYFPQIDIASGKPLCLAFTRSMPGQLTLGFREQINQITSFADASNIYGSDLCAMRELREFVGGRLNSTKTFHGGLDLLPVTDENKECKSPSGYCFEAGDARSSEQPVLASLHTILMRYHNKLVGELSRLNPQWSDEKLFQEGRRINAAVQQHITWNEFLPRVLGWNAINLYELGLLSDGFYNSYDERCNPTVLNEFAAAAFRFGHSLLKPSFKRMDSSYKDKGADMRLGEFFFNSDPLHEPNTLDDLIRGVSATPMETLDNFITDQVTNHLFEDKKNPFSGLDLASLNLQRARDHGIPGYNLYRAICNLTKAQDFSDLSREIPAPVIERLERTYAHVDDIDLFSGGLSETPLHGGLVGPTFACIIGIQFRNLRKCDRFWYEGGNPLTRFTEPQLAEIRKMTAAKMVCDNCDEMLSIQRAMFDMPDPFLNPRVPCSSLPDINLEFWKERVDCSINGIDIETGDAKRVSPCTMCTCTKEGPLCQSLKIENCFHLAQSFTPKDILNDHVCKVQCAFAFRAFPTVRTGANKIGIS